MNVSKTIVILTIVSLLTACSPAPTGAKADTAEHTSSTDRAKAEPGSLSDGQVIGVWAGTSSTGDVNVFILWNDKKASQSPLTSVGTSWDMAWKIERGNLYLGGIDEERGMSTPLPNLGGEIKGDELHLSSEVLEGISILKKISSTPPPHNASPEELIQLTKDIKKTLGR